MHPFFLFFVQIFRSTPQDKHKDDDLEEQDSSQISISKNNHSEEVKPCHCKNDNNGDKLKDAFASLDVDSLYDSWFWDFVYDNLDHVLKNYEKERKIFINTGRVKICKEQLKKIFANLNLTALFDKSLTVEAKNDGERRIADESHIKGTNIDQQHQFSKKSTSIIREAIYNKAFNWLKDSYVDGAEFYIQKMAERDTDI